jgi:alkylated DNA repair dioxygenase AlkB
VFVQGSLLTGEVERPRHHLDATSWVDLVCGWLPHPDEMFDELARCAGWRQGRRIMWGQELDEPRLTLGWEPGAEPSALVPVRDRLEERFGADLAGFWINLYRDGQDAVAWHGDRIGRAVRDPFVATITLGSTRRFLLRPRGGGPSTSFSPGPGDLLVMGGSCQHDWEHSVPRCSRSGPRMSITIRQQPCAPDIPALGDAVAP